MVAPKSRITGTLFIRAALGLASQDTFQLASLLPAFLNLEHNPQLKSLLSILFPESKDVDRLISHFFSDQPLDQKTFEKNIIHNEMFRVLIQHAVKKAFFKEPDSDLFDVKLDSDSLLLSSVDIFVLYFHIAGSEFAGNRWKRIFSAVEDGCSWSQFLGCLENNPGATIIAVKDKNGSVFGGFACSEWAKKPHFYGNSLNFLFSLQDSLAIWKSTGWNNNWQYLNYSAQTMPNGLFCSVIL